LVGKSPLVHRLSPAENSVTTGRSYAMSRLNDACPYESQVRAARCESCCEVSGGLPPCVASWLRTENRTRTTNIIELPVRQQKAA
jgi:hypothetical protein